MVLGTVIGSVWSTKKTRTLTGQALLLVAPQSMSGPPMVAADCVGAGEGETVLIATGSAARMAAGTEVPVDAAIVGIIDNH